MYSFETDRQTIKQNRVKSTVKGINRMVENTWDGSTFGQYDQKTPI